MDLPTFRQVLASQCRLVPSLAVVPQVAMFSSGLVDRSDWFTVLSFRGIHERHDVTVSHASGV